MKVLGDVFISKTLTGASSIEVGDGTSYTVPLRIKPGTQDLPTCDVNKRGGLYLQAIAGQRDRIAACLRNYDGTFSWKNVAVGD